MCLFQGRLSADAAIGKHDKSPEDAGFLSDSSVSKGMEADDNLRLLDFSSAHSRYVRGKHPSLKYVILIQMEKYLNFQYYLIV